LAIGNLHDSGFTLIELLVVIGIILLLIGLFYGGVKLVTAQAKERDTRTMLETCKTMFENYRQATHLAITGISAPVPNVPKGASSVTTPTGTVIVMAFTVGNTATGSQIWDMGNEPTLGAVTSDSLGLSNANRTLPRGRLPDALQNTEVIMQAMLTLPENQTILNNLPPSKVGKDAATNIPLILDGWGNPIFFCPGGGLTAVWVDPAYGQPEVITSDGVKGNGYDPTNTTYVPAGTPVPNQPFFVSAGPDGDCSNAHGWTSGTPNSNQTDDNIYSFK
jgi:prepilin-type N-terminal cleavage/methylation domain-containing protein